MLVTEGSQKGSQSFLGDAQEKPVGLQKEVAPHGICCLPRKTQPLAAPLEVLQTLPGNGESNNKRRMQSLTVDITITPCFGPAFCRAYAHFFSLSKEVGRTRNSLFSLKLFLSVNDSRLSIQQVREIRESAISKTVTSEAASFKTVKKTFKLVRKGREGFTVNSCINY